MQSRVIWVRWMLAAVLLWVSFLPQFPVQAQSEPPGGEVDAEAAFYPDPGAYFKVGSTAYAVTAADCDPLTAGEQVCDNPLQAAVEFLTAQNLTPAGGKIILGAGVYNLGGATNPGPNWNIDGAVWTAYPPKLTLVGMGSALGGATTTLLQGYVSLSNLGSLTMSNMLIQGGSIGTGNTSGQITLDRVQVLNSPSTCISIAGHQGSLTASQVLVNGCAAGGDGFSADVTGGVKMIASHVNAAASDGIYLIAGEPVTLLNVSSHINAGYGLYIQNRPDTAPRVSLTGVSITRNTSVGAHIATPNAVSVDRSNFANNSSTGLVVLNIEPGSAPPVTLLRSQWIRNSSSIYIQSAGRILVDGIRSEANIGGANIALLNTAGTQPIQISSRLGPNTLLNNVGVFIIQSGSKVSVTGLNAVRSQGLQITAPNSSVTLARSSIIYSLDYPGLTITSGGATTLSDVRVNRNSGDGAFLNITSAAGPTRILRSQFNGNNGLGISLATLGRTQISQVEASNNAGLGMQVVNTAGNPTGWWVTVQQSVFNANAGGSGLKVTSNGGVQARRISALDNNTFGMEVEFSAPVPFQLTGKPGDNRFVGNLGTGLSAVGMSRLVVSGVDASQNNVMGVRVDGPAAQEFQFTNVQANGNSFIGVYATGSGRMLFKNIAADNNGRGLFTGTYYSADVKQDISILSSHFDGNIDLGLDLRTSRPVLLNGVSASHTQVGSGAAITDYGGPNVTEKVEILSTLGKNYFDNNAVSGIEVTNTRSFTASYLSARGNARNTTQPGVYLSGPDAPVTLTCAVVTGNPADGLKTETGAALVKIVNGMLDGNTRLNPSLYANIRLTNPATTLDYKPGLCSGW
ncbi:right-handed parallel beta-helix repeat-containing protein [Levilinea saccharolytica]|uniref:Right handed beta helix domain-containing protein n=1 Tax=Levilinea saccharolytica TaxID=229921 RepID=A0A0N8GMN0_9CHLR|nr:right-handed parallel beta-helix repeat-containing protein [Levilinea saccharolytica]KPL75754.1 hypothetical protein ADN01_18225 [Levilinea saccharolytica]GAP16712.1 right handed beta helix region [Levilinea saccharolytica]